jgi:hypothetical protein
MPIALAELESIARPSAAVAARAKMVDLRFIELLLGDPWTASLRIVDCLSVRLVETLPPKVQASQKQRPFIGIHFIRNRVKQRPAAVRTAGSGRAVSVQ